VEEVESKGEVKAEFCSLDDDQHKVGTVNWYGLIVGLMGGLFDGWARRSREYRLVMDQYLNGCESRSFEGLMVRRSLTLIAS
jgi:hypothetical protein